MTIFIRIVIGIAWIIFAFYTGEHEGKTITQKHLTAKEKQYIDFLQCYTYLSSLFIAVLIICIIEN